MDPSSVLLTEVFSVYGSGVFLTQLEGPRLEGVVMYSF